MARITYGPLITEIRGSIGGITFQKNSSGPIARLKPLTPMVPSTPQSDRQNYMATLVNRWAYLSEENKELWRVFAEANLKTDDFGETRSISGYQWFISYNLNSYTQGYGYWEYPQDLEIPDPPPQFTLEATNSYLRINFGSPYTCPGEFMGIYATAPIKMSNIKLRRGVFLIDMVSFSGEQYIDITSVWSSFFNITWSNFFASATANIIVRTKNFTEDSGYTSMFTSALIQIRN
jgi:hypothetical protein